MFTDTHCHLASYRYDATEIPEIVSRALESGITRQITLATGMDDIDSTLALAEAHDSIYACLGIHPCDVTEAPDDAISQIAPKIAHEKVVAIGESGLDYYHPAPDGWTEEDYHARQLMMLEQQFDLAAAHNLNICLHTRDRSGTASFDACMALYRRYADRVRAVFHCFPGTVEQAQSIIELGGLVSFTGNVTFKNAKQIQETATALPLGTFMLETDAPYLAPVPHRGSKNEPMHVASIAQFIADQRQITLAELSSATEQVTNDFFKLA